jgi:hypothetical protein
MGRYTCKLHLAHLDVTDTRTGHVWHVPWSRIAQFQYGSVFFGGEFRKAHAGLPRGVEAHLPGEVVSRLRRRALRHELLTGRHDRQWRCSPPLPDWFLILGGVINTTLFAWFIHDKSSTPVWQEMLGSPYKWLFLVGTGLALLNFGAICFLPWIALLLTWSRRRRYGRVISVHTTSRGLEVEYADARRVTYTWSDVIEVRRRGRLRLAVPPFELNAEFNAEMGEWLALASAAIYTCVPRSEALANMRRIRRNGTVVVLLGGAAVLACVEGLRRADLLPNAPRDDLSPSAAVIIFCLFLLSSLWGGYWLVTPSGVALQRRWRRWLRRRFSRRNAAQSLSRRTSAAGA